MPSASPAPRILRRRWSAPSAAGRAALLELCTDPEQISTRTTITSLRAAAEKRQAQTVADE